MAIIFRPIIADWSVQILFYTFHKNLLDEEKRITLVQPSPPFINQANEASAGGLLHRKAQHRQAGTLPDGSHLVVERADTMPRRCLGNQNVCPVIARSQTRPRHVTAGYVRSRIGSSYDPESDVTLSRANNRITVISPTQ